MAGLEQMEHLLNSDIQVGIKEGSKLHFYVDYRLITTFSHFSILSPPGWRGPAPLLPARLAGCRPPAPGAGELLGPAAPYLLAPPAGPLPLPAEGGRGGAGAGWGEGAPGSG